MGRTRALHVEEIDVVSRGVYHGPESHGVGDLSMEPDVLICREKPCEAGTNDTNDISQHWNQNEATIEGEGETCPSRNPYGECQSVESREFLVCFL